MKDRDSVSLALQTNRLAHVRGWYTSHLTSLIRRMEAHVDAPHRKVGCAYTRAGNRIRHSWMTVEVRISATRRESEKLQLSNWRTPRSNQRIPRSPDLFKRAVELYHPHVKSNRTRHRVLRVFSSLIITLLFSKIRIKNGSRGLILYTFFRASFVVRWFLSFVFFRLSKRILRCIHLRCRHPKWRLSNRHTTPSRAGNALTSHVVHCTL